MAAPFAKLATIQLRGQDPFEYGKDIGYFFPVLTNDDDTTLYFDPYYGLGPLQEDSEPIPAAQRALQYGKKTQTIESIVIDNVGQYLRNHTFGFYLNTESQFDGVVRIDAKTSHAYVKQAAGEKGHDIMNPKDIDSGASLLFMCRFQYAESGFPYMQSERNVELSAYSRNSRSFNLFFTLPFTANYLPIGTGTVPLQSVLAQNFIYLVLNPSLDSPILTVPRNPSRWHVLIYDVKEDALYSVWHGMDESDGMAPLSFSYYLGQEGLYFEVLKEGKIEIYLLDIDLTKAKPLAEYETVDLLWNNKGLKELWQKEIDKAKKADSSFSPVWR